MVWMVCASQSLGSNRSVTSVLGLGRVRILLPDEGHGCKFAKGVVKVVHKILGNFEVIVLIRVGGVPPISERRKEL